MRSMARPRISRLSAGLRRFSSASNEEGEVLRLESLPIKRQLPVDTPLPGLPVLKPANQLTAPRTEITTLSNGLRVASQETYGQSTTLGVFVDAGSRYEDGSNSGVSHMLEHLAFKSSLKRSHKELFRDIEDIGGAVHASASRESMIYTADVLRHNVGKAMGLLSESVTTPALLEEEIDQTKAIIEIELDEMKTNYQSLITEKLHEAAFGAESPLGRPLICPAEQLPKLNAQTARDFMNRLYTPDRMVVAAAGVDHKEFVAMAEEKFGHLPAATREMPLQSASSKYIGGDLRFSSDADLSYVALAFETAGWHDDDLVPACVLHTLLGGGDSFSAGGPGKGMYTRLYREVLNRYYWAESASAFTTINTDVGLIGIYGACVPSFVGNLVAVMCNQMRRIAEFQVEPDELARARNQLKSSVLMNLEQRLILHEDIGRQILIYGRRIDPAVICEQIDNVTAGDILRIAQRALSSKPTLVSYGALDKLPSYENVALALK